jgi:photosynthetic reaction center H subunit
MKTGGITSYIDVAQLVLYAFWIFFAGLIIYLRKEDKREGYPLESDRSERAPRVKIQGFPAMPRVAKRFKLPHGRGYAVAGRVDKQAIPGRPTLGFPGAPLEPTDNPMLGGIGPGSYALRADEPDLTHEGENKLAPLRVASGFYVSAGDLDPIGMPVFGGDMIEGGVVRDLWIDRAEPQVRYYEVEVAANGRRVLLPAGFARVDAAQRRIRVRSIFSHHFADVPGTASPDVVTLLEEEKISAYYGAGTLYAEPSRLGPEL